MKQNIDDSTGMVDLAKVFRGIETELAAEGRFDCEGCTATVAFIHRHAGKRFLQVANVGDSTAFLRYRETVANEKEVTFLKRETFLINASMHK